MGQLLDEDPYADGIGGTLLRDFIFPGTHDSGTYVDYRLGGSPLLAGQVDAWYGPFITFGLLLGSPIVNNLALTQSKSVYCQLWEGARSFDLRVVSDALGAFDLGLLEVYTVHTIVTAPMEEILLDLARFLGEEGHDAEIVFLNFEDKGAAGEKFLPVEARQFLSQQLYQIPVGTSGQFLGDYLIEFQDDDVQEVSNRDSITNSLPYSLEAFGDGSQTAYPYGFEDGGDGDCEPLSEDQATPPGEGDYLCTFLVTVAGANKAFPADYSVDRDINQITFTSAPASGAKVSITSFYRPLVAEYITAGGGTRIGQAGPPASSNPARGQVIITAPEQWRCDMNQANHADETCADQPGAPYPDPYSPDPGIFGGKNLKRVLWPVMPRTCCEFFGIDGDKYPRVDKRPLGYYDEAGVRYNMQRVIEGRARPNPPRDEQMRVMGLHLAPDSMLADCLLDPGSLADEYSLLSNNCSAKTIADFVAMNVVPQIVAMKRRDVNIIHIDNYNPALTDEVYKLNKGAARVVAQITTAEDVGDDADPFPGGEAELYPRFLWWGSVDDYLGGMPRLVSAVETTRSLLADLYLMGTDLRLNETHSKYANVSSRWVVTNENPRWTSYRSFPLNSHPLLLMQLWDEDDGTAGRDDQLCLASSVPPVSECTERKTLPVDECIHGDTDRCFLEGRSARIQGFDNISYRVQICNWSSGECDGIVPPPPPPVIRSGGTTAEQCGATHPGWEVELDQLEVEYRYDPSDLPPVVSIDWGDGTIDDAEFVPGAGAAGEIVTGTVIGSHAYATGGIFNVTVKVEHDSSGLLQTDVEYFFALVTGARLAGDELQVVGSNGRDHFWIKSKSGNSAVADKSKQNEVELKLQLDEDVQGRGWDRKVDLREPAAEVGALLVTTCDGDDKISVSHDVTVPATLKGGAGADKIHAGGGPSRIYGDEGDDDLVGGNALDFIDGGPGDYDRCRSKPGGADSFVNCEVR